MVPGKKYPDEHIIFTAHWDHDGISENPINGDSILNGAIDNASGTAMIIESARVMAAQKEKTARSMVFFLTSSEELGLLGAKYYAKHPILPLNKTVCVINTDAAHATEPLRIAVNILKGHTDMDEVIDHVAEKIGREIIPDPTPQIGAFQRSDHYPFVDKGIPAAWIVGGADPIKGDSARAMQIVYEYGSTKYHQVTDEYYDGFLMGNIALDTKMNLALGYYYANSKDWPNWIQGSPYKTLRDDLMEKKNN